MTDITDISENDFDMLSCDIQDHFKTPYSLKQHKSVGLDDTYVLQLSSNSESNQILAGLSNQSIQIFDGLELNKLHTQTFEKPVIDAKFSPVDAQLFYAGFDDQIQLWDLRTPKKPVLKCDLTENIENGHKNKPFLSFDVNKDDRYLSCGTQVVNNDAFVLFWDIKASGKFLGGKI